MWIKVMPNELKPQNTFPPYALGTRLLLFTSINSISFGLCSVWQHPVPPELYTEPRMRCPSLTEHLGFAPKPSIQPPGSPKPGYSSEIWPKVTWP